MCNEYLLMHFNVLKKQNFCVFVFVDGLLMLNECLFGVKKKKKNLFIFSTPLTLSPDSIPEAIVAKLIYFLQDWHDLHFFIFNKHMHYND